MCCFFNQREKLLEDDVYSSNNMAASARERGVVNRSWDFVTLRCFRSKSVSTIRLYSIVYFLSYFSSSYSILSWLNILVLSIVESALSENLKRLSNGKMIQKEKTKRKTEVKEERNRQTNRIFFSMCYICQLRYCHKC